MAIILSAMPYPTIANNPIKLASLVPIPAIVTGINPTMLHKGNKPKK